MMNYLKHFSFLLVIIVLAGCGAHSRNSAFISQWSNAILISPDETEKKWQEDIDLSDGVTALLNAQSGIFGFVKIQYSDETNERSVYRFSGYSHVQEIRIEYDNTKLFVMIHTTCPGLFSDKECSKLIIYDLQNRILLNTIELNSDNIQIDEVSVN
jgi:hypothetical protein